MNKSAMKYQTGKDIMPETRINRQDAFATNRTQERKRPPTAKTRSQNEPPK